MDLTPFRSSEVEDATLKGMLEASSVAERGLRHSLYKLESSAQRVFAFIEP
jgi:hypothetical protein